MYVDHAILCDMLAGVSCVPIVQSTSGDQFGGIFWNLVVRIFHEKIFYFREAGREFLIVHIRVCCTGRLGVYSATFRAGLR